MKAAVMLKTAILLAAALLCLPGCLGRFAANQGRRQAARSADHYARKYAQPELEEYYGDNPEAVRQAHNNMADTIVRSGNPRQKTRVGVDERGWLTDEGY